MSILTKAICLALPLTALNIMTAQAQNVSLTDNVYFITEQLIVPVGSSKPWQWVGLEKLPNPQNSYSQKASNQYSENKSAYTLSRSIVGEKAIEARGPKAGPNVIFFTSGYGEGDELWKLSQIVNTANVSKLKSNCTLKNITTSSKDSDVETGETLEYQNFYKWQRAGSQPLYIAESKGEGHVITSVFNSYNWKNYTVVRDPKLFNKYDVWNTTKNGKKVTCSFS